jgi:hypothetical protein
LEDRGIVAAYNYLDIEKNQKVQKEIYLSELQKLQATVKKM